MTLIKRLLFLALLIPSIAHAVPVDWCGDGIDADSSGGDVACGGVDSDFDSFETGQDCDDSNNQIYTGVYTASGCSAGSYRLCQAGGVYSSCVASSTTPLCEATGAGSCFYINFNTGSDSNLGTYASPFKTWANFNTYYAPGDRPAGWRQPVAGDVYYFFSGTYPTTIAYQPGVSQRMLNIRGYSGNAINPIIFKAYPGETPIFSPSSNFDFPIVYIQDASYIYVQGLEVGPITKATAGTSQATGIWIGGTSNYCDISRNYIHNVNGARNDNPGGLYNNGGSFNDIHHNKFKDNYDTTLTGENNSQIQNFSGDGNRYRYNIIYFTDDPSVTPHGACFKYKQATPTATTTTEITGNTCWNAYLMAIHSAQPKSVISRNRISDFYFNAAVDDDWGAIYIGNRGNTSCLRDIIVEYNTLVNTRGALEYNPNNNDCTGNTFTYRYNVFTDRSGINYGGTDSVGTMNIHRYGSDALFTEYVPAKLAINNNCYYSPTSSFQAEVFSSGSGGSLGATLNLAGWQGAGYLQDINSFDTNPSFNSVYVPNNTNCSSWGWSQAAVGGGGGGGGSSAGDVDFSKWIIVFRRGR